MTLYPVKGGGKIWINNLGVVDVGYVITELVAVLRSFPAANSQPHLQGQEDSHHLIVKKSKLLYAASGGGWRTLPPGPETWGKSLSKTCWNIMDLSFMERSIRRPDNPVHAGQDGLRCQP